jgi:glycosyltransferase involved in cell wall biosynthesis
MADVKIVCATMISIIIPYYNAGTWISRTLDSCIQQAEFLKEIIVIDDFSSDAGWETVSGYQARFPELIVARKNTNKGGNNARNLGFDLSAGKYVQWLDADDQILPGKFARQLAVFEKYNETDIVYSDWQLDTYNEAGEIVATEVKYQQQHADFLMRLLIDDWSPPHSYLLKRSFADKLRKMHAWNPETPVFQDREYFTLAAIEGARFRYAAGISCIYNRWNRGSVSQNQKQRDATHLKLSAAFLRHIGNSDRFEQDAKKKYKKVIVTERALTTLSRNNLSIRDKEFKIGNIYWPMITGYRNKIKIVFALIRNLFTGKA